MVSRVAAVSPVNVQISLPYFADVLARCSLLAIQTTTDLQQDKH